MAMPRLNTHYKKLKREYLFPIIEKKLLDLKAQNPSAKIVNLGIGDVAFPLVPSVAKAISDAAFEMTTFQGMRGYGPAEGYSFLREAILKNEYSSLDLAADEIFISDGANSDIANIQELFSLNNVIAITDPTYPVYLDTNIMAGRHKKIVLLPCTKENGFSPLPPERHCDLIYLCTPNNPTGVALTRVQLKAWVDYAIRENAVLLIDNAYDAFVTSPDVPRSIFEIPGAKDVAIEFRTFSKSAGFTALRCGYTVFPKSVFHGKLYPMWVRRQSAKTNGVSYPIQKGAEAVFTPQGQKETKAQVRAYLDHARRLREGLSSLGFEYFGGVDSPYIWWKTPQDMPSWNFFDTLLEKCHLVAIPGRGFGTHGEGFIRLSSFTTEHDVTLALEKLCALR